MRAHVPRNCRRVKAYTKNLMNQNKLPREKRSVDQIIKEKYPGLIIAVRSPRG